VVKVKEKVVVIKEAYNKEEDYSNKAEDKAEAFSNQ